jgi:hypothetical protein
MMNGSNRRAFLRALGSVAAAAALPFDVERLLWTRKPIITVPAMPQPWVKVTPELRAWILGDGVRGCVIDVDGSIRREGGAIPRVARNGDASRSQKQAARDARSLRLAAAAGIVAGGNSRTSAQTGRRAGKAAPAGSLLWRLRVIPTKTSTRVGAGFRRPPTSSVSNWSDWQRRSPRDTARRRRWLRRSATARRNARSWSQNSASSKPHLQCRRRQA